MVKTNIRQLCLEASRQFNEDVRNLLYPVVMTEGGEVEWMTINTFCNLFEHDSQYLDTKMGCLQVADIACTPLEALKNADFEASFGEWVSDLVEDGRAADAYGLLPVNPVLCDYEELRQYLVESIFEYANIDVSSMCSMSVGEGV